MIVQQNTGRQACHFQALRYRGTSEDLLKWAFILINEEHHHIAYLILLLRNSSTMTTVCGMTLGALHVSSRTELSLDIQACLLLQNM